MRPGALGDALVSLPAIAALRAHYPRVRMIAAGHRDAFELAVPNYVNEALRFDDPRLLPLFIPDGTIPTETRKLLDGIDAAIVWLSDPGCVTAQLEAMGIKALTAAPFPRRTSPPAPRGTRSWQRGGGQFSAGPGERAMPSPLSLWGRVREGVLPATRGLRRQGSALSPALSGCPLGGERGSGGAVARHLLRTLQPLGVPDRFVPVPLLPTPQALSAAEEALSRIGLPRVTLSNSSLRHPGPASPPVPLSIANGEGVAAAAAGGEAIRPGAHQDIVADPTIHPSPDADRPPKERETLNTDDVRSEIVLIHPGSGGQRKRWPAGSVAELCTMLDRSGRKPVLLQGPADEAAVSEVLDAASPRPPVVGRLPLATVHGLLGLVGTYVGMDSGITQLAALTGARTVAAFGPSDPALWMPVGPRVAVVDAATPSCDRSCRSCSSCSCLKRLAPETVFDVLRQSGFRWC